ncbi:MAG: hypothetical protein KatS3mg038_0065 [Candidatus Kapaibacterium sp.]|nr:MAG: hypothetical protein KatS3mg038_0065 [Candidatus Kapabacteria bacterium]
MIFPPLRTGAAGSRLHDTSAISQRRTLCPLRSCMQRCHSTKMAATCTILFVLPNEAHNCVRASTSHVLEIAKL